MKEAYVSFEVAELLKKKGFAESSFAYYSKFDDWKILRFWRKYARNPINTFYLCAPTHQMAMAWLRERNIGIVPEIHTTIDPKDYYWGACIFHLDKSWDILQYVSEPSKNIIDGYNDVIEQALKYVLENLIK